MTGPQGVRRSTVRRFALYALMSLIPVLVLGVVLAAAIRAEATRRGLAEGRTNAILFAQMAIEPQLDGRPLSAQLNPVERQRLRRLVQRAIGGRKVLRLRLRSSSGRVIFSGDGSGFGEPLDDEALAAARGTVVARLTHLNADSNDLGSAGVAAVEIYEPLSAGAPSRRVGVLELYLPYAPISRDVSGGLSVRYRDLAVGLAVLYLVLFAISVSATRGLRRQLAVNAFLAEHDTLTELPNRMLFHRYASLAVAASSREHPSALAIVDLDRFKEVNDTLGHHNGDRLLTELSRRLVAAMRPGDAVARLGGDEFGLVLRDIQDPEPMLRGLREVIDREVEIDDLPLSVEASIGFVLAPHDGDDVDVLLQGADLAMYAAKTQHAGVMHYTESLDQYDAHNLTLVSELRTGIDAGELILHYQPQVSLPEGRVTAVEALVRWQHPTEGLLHPGRFLPLAEQTDVIDKLTHWVIGTALREVAARHPQLSVAVNVSARSLTRGSFADHVIGILRETGVPAAQLIVEVTETALLADPQRAAKVLERLSSIGVNISIDDFGQGHSSLAYLSVLPVTELKIDRSFVADMLENDAHQSIVRSIIDLGHNLDLRVVGEGVETAEVLAALRDGGCDAAQGFLLARPMPAASLPEWLAPQGPDAEPELASVSTRRITP
jgi:diguanylate cyclase (GGDEF)-like protein